MERRCSHQLQAESGTDSAAVETLPAKTRSLPMIEAISVTVHYLTLVNAAIRLTKLSFFIPIHRNSDIHK